MSQRVKDGIFLDSMITINDEKREGFPTFMRCLQFLAIFVGSFSSVSILKDCLSIPVSGTTLFYSVFIVSILLFAMLVIPSFDLVKVVMVTLFYGLFLFSRLSNLRNAFYIVENAVIDRINTYYGSGMVHYMARYSTAHTDATILLIMVIIPLTALLAIAVIRGTYANLSGIILFLPVAATFAVGLIPSERYLIPYLVTMLYLHRTSSSGRHQSSRQQRTLLQRINNRAALWLSIMGIALFFIMKLFVSPQEYNGVEKIKEAKADLQNYMFSFSLEDVSNQLRYSLPMARSASGGLNNGVLGKVDQVKYNNAEHLKLWAPMSSLTEGLYLKGFVGSDYTGDSWVGHGKDDRQRYDNLLKSLPKDKFSTVNQVSDLLYQMSENSMEQQSSSIGSRYQFTQGQIRIQYEIANKNYLYLPYFTQLSQSDKAIYRSDLYAAPSAKDDSYQYNYYYNLTLADNITDLFDSSLKNKLGDYATYENLYRKYVYDVYTELPTKGLDRLKKDFSLNNPDIVGKTVTEKIEYVKNYLNMNTHYSLSPGRLPKGKDFVEYFLYDSKVGYCTHYASAAVLMLRAMGVPARYVEGYAIGSSEITSTSSAGNQEDTIFSDRSVSQYKDIEVEASVKDYNAHAWVEVYIDGIGWNPVEFTPGAAVTSTDKSIKDMLLIGDDMKKNIPPKAAPSATPEPTKDPDKQDTLTPTDKPNAQDRNNSDKSHTNGDKGNDLNINAAQIMVITLFAGIILLAIYFIWRIYRKRRAKTTRNRNKKVIYLYSEIEKMLSANHSIPRHERLEDHVKEVLTNTPFALEGNFEAFMDTVTKARFGKGSINPHELTDAENFHRSLYHKVVQNLSFGKRIYLKLLLLL